MKEQPSATGDTADLEHILLVQELDSDSVEEYVAAHDDVPDRVVELMRTHGVERYELFVYDDLAISYVVAEDFAAFEEAYGDDERAMEWEQRVSAFKDSGVDPETGEMPDADRIWTLEDA
jgi:L-rhamnose mutarotase